MIPAELIKAARDLYALHGLLPVPVSGKIPIGGFGWQLLSFETRMHHAQSQSCTGIGIQMGKINHPVLGEVEARCIDADIDDPQKSMLFIHTLQKFFPIYELRWGRRPATIVFTDVDAIKQEKFGSVQLLGNGKQAVWFGEYHNKEPLPSDPREYIHQGKGIFDQMPPLVSGILLRSAVEASCAAIGEPVIHKPRIADAVPLTSDELATLSTQTVVRFKTDMQSMLADIERSPTGSGRGTKLYNLGIKHGALIKASGCASMLIAAAEDMTGYVEYDVIVNPILTEIGQMAEQAFLQLPGNLGKGDQRDFARGVAVSKGLTATIEVQKAKIDLPIPGKKSPAQSSIELMKENLPPLRFLVPKFIPDCGCIIFAGKPKVGKGWFVLDLAMKVAAGGIFWDQQCQQAGALCYMLEDGKRRIKERLSAIQPLFPGHSNLLFRYSVDGPFYVNADGTGTLLDDIRDHMRMYPHIKLIIVDVLQRIRGSENKGEDAYMKDYKIVGAIQKLAVECNVLIWIVHHTKKGRVDDVIDSISGSMGISGSSDGSIILGKEGDLMRLEARMRDVVQYDFDMIKEEGSPVWKPAITATEMFMPAEGSKTRQVVEVLREARCALKPGDIHVRTGIPEKNVATYLIRMEKSSQVNKVSRGLYMAVGLAYRERIQGVIDILKRLSKTPATTELKLQYAPNFNIPPEASFMILTPVAIKEIEGGFVDGKDCLTSLKHRGLAVFNSDTTWLVGDDWEPKGPVQAPNPFAFKFPWEV